MRISIVSTSKCREPVRAIWHDQAMGQRVCLLALLLVACGDETTVATDAADATTDAGTDGGLDAGFDLPLETWTWVDVPGMVCGNGSPTGIAINPSTRSQKLVILVEGGGACWEAANCYGILVPITAVHLDGFNAQTFAGIRARFGSVLAKRRQVELLRPPELVRPRLTLSADCSRWHPLQCSDRENDELHHQLLLYQVLLD